MTNGNVKTENGKLIAHPLAAHLYRPLRPSGTSPNLEEESGCEPTFMFQSFKFHVSIHFVPLSQGDEEQSSGGGMTNGKRKGERGKRKPIARRSSLQTPPPFGHPLRAPTLDWGV